MDLNKPLAYRVRPKSLDEFVGQEHVVGKDKFLYRTIKADRLSSLILWGPPGCGKTTLFADVARRLIKAHKAQGEPFRVLYLAVEGSKELMKKLLQ